MRTMRLGFGVLLVGLFASAAAGRWVRPDYIPAERLIANAEAYIAEAGTPGAVNVDGKEVTFYWEIQESSFENRENYSMGGGTYLGRSRYSGWKVASSAGPWSGSESVEFWSGLRQAAPVVVESPPAADPVNESPAVDLSEVEAMAWL